MKVARRYFDGFGAGRHDRSRVSCLCDARARSGRPEKCSVNFHEIENAWNGGNTIVQALRSALCIDSRLQACRSLQNCGRIFCFLTDLFRRYCIVTERVVVVLGISIISFGEAQHHREYFARGHISGYHREVLVILIVPGSRLIRIL